LNLPTNNAAGGTFAKSPPSELLSGPPENEDLRRIAKSATE